MQFSCLHIPHEIEALDFVLACGLPKRWAMAEMFAVCSIGDNMPDNAHEPHGSRNDFSVLRLSSEKCQIPQRTGRNNEASEKEVTCCCLPSLALGFKHLRLKKNIARGTVTAETCSSHCPLIMELRQGQFI